MSQTAQDRLNEQAIERELERWAFAGPNPNPPEEVTPLRPSVFRASTTLDTYGEVADEHRDVMEEMDRWS